MEKRMRMKMKLLERFYKKNTGFQVKKKFDIKDEI
jgi:hypothetical protein